jgi:imidazolonepropionase-like amidohydrolase
VLAVLSAVASLPESIVAQRPSDTPNPPAFYAIQNVRIVPVSGSVIEDGTVVIAKGLIESVGVGVPIPPEAWVIDGSGLTVYPGLFDGMSSVGVRAPDEEDGGGPGGAGGFSFPGQGQDIAEGPEDRPATTPWTNAADLLDPESDAIERWRKGGFTSAVIVPDGGIVTGQAAIVNLAGDEREMVVKTPAALRITMDSPGGFRSFPGSLFGVISYVKQLYADAEHQARYAAAYEANPSGRERPRYDRALEPIQRSIQEGWPTILPGVEKREIRRAVKLGADVGARTVVAGAHDAYAIADELAASGVSVLVSLDWPERGRDVDPESQEALESLRRRANAPTTPARLHEAGVTWAFYSAGLASPREVIRKVNTAIENGLPREAALRAMTLGPAEIFGVADRMGSIAPGKIANLVVTDGDLLDEDTKVKMVFVDGQKFEELEAERPSEPPTVDVSGRWLLTIPTPQRTQEVTADLEMAEDGTLSGTLTSDRGESTITEGWVSGDSFRFVASTSMGGRTFEVTYMGTIEREELRGTVSFGGRFSTDFTGERPGGGV